MLAVTGLETNGDLGIEAYQRDSREWIRRVSLYGTGENSEEGHNDDYSGNDKAPLYIQPDS